jgi:hypothetical protein
MTLALFFPSLTCRGEIKISDPTLPSNLSRVHLNIYDLCRDDVVDRDSSVGIATLYGLDGPGIESRWV